MYSLFRKEITSFYGSLTGYLIALVFLIGNGLFLWVFPGSFNILDGGYASLNGYFELAPWVFLFLVPALTMRLLAEEKRLGTMEILVTRPISLFQLVWAKYLAGVVLVVICLLPTLVYFYSVYFLGNPIGNWDGGAAWGSFIGLFFLAASYVAIGLFSSSVTDNPVFAFVLALFICFFFYLGFDFASGLSFSVELSNFLLPLGINEHYLSMSRGVLDSRDLVYFILLIVFFLVLTSLTIQSKQKKIKSQIKKIATLLVTLLIVSLISGAWFFRLDLTSEKKYSLNELSKELVQELESPVKVDLFLAGDLPTGMRNLQQAVKEKIQDINAYSSERVRLQVHDPYEMTNNQKDRNQLFERLVDLGIQPTDLRLKKDEGTVSRFIFPGVVIRYKDYEIGVNLLKNNPSFHHEVNLNNSIETVEYEIISALRQLMVDEKPVVAFLNGQDELSRIETFDIRQSLLENFQVKNLYAVELNREENFPKALIVADPQKPFSEEDKFYIDQYLMRGGNLLWLIDPVQVSLDSLQRGETTLAFPRDLNLSDQLFRYGIRLNPNLVQDVDCISLPVNTAPAGSPTKFTPAPWYYSPLLRPSGHELGRNLNRLKSGFVSLVDTVGKDDQLKKSVILHTSQYSRQIRTPLQVSLQSINNPPSRELFNEQKLPVGVLVEGRFRSAFKNRMVDQLNKTNIQVMAESKPAKMIVLADGSLIANQYTRKNGQLQAMALGYDRYSNQTFGNKAFLLNAVNYLCDEIGIMSLRSRVFQIRLLDKVKIREQRLVWQLINVVFPIVLILLFGLIFRLIRKWKYAR